MIDNMKRRLADIDRQLKTKKHLEYFKNLLMKKKLKIKFWKAEKALAMQILKQEGLPKNKVKGVICITGSPELYREEVHLRGIHSQYDLYISALYFRSNPERDAYLDKITQSITDELFTSNGELKVGDMCEVRDLEYEDWQTRKLLAILPQNYIIRFIVKMDEVKDDWVDFRQARPLCKRTEPKVEECGELITYTWEEK